jgi:hypothetical protein
MDVFQGYAKSIHIMTLLASLVRENGTKNKEKWISKERKQSSMYHVMEN